MIGVIACLFAAFLGIWLAGFRDDAGGATGSGATSAGGTGFNGALRPPGAMVPDFELTDQHGDVVSPAKLRGKVTVYAFIYSHCEDVCPLEVQQIRGALDQLGRDVPVVGVSVDPVNDTRGSATAFLIKQHMTGRMQFALGSERELAPVWKAFGIQPQRDGLDHSAHVVVADAQGRQRLGYPAEQLTPDLLEDDLRRLGA